MKLTKIKRIVLTNDQGETIISAEQFDYALSDANILGAYHEIGKTAWIGNSLWYLRANAPLYRVTVETFYQYQKRWYEIMLDAVRRI